MCIRLYLLALSFSLTLYEDDSHLRHFGTQTARVHHKNIDKILMITR